MENLSNLERKPERKTERFFSMVIEKSSKPIRKQWRKTEDI